MKIIQLRTYQSFWFKLSSYLYTIFILCNLKYNVNLINLLYSKNIFGNKKLLSLAKVMIIKSTFIHQDFYFYALYSKKFFNNKNIIITSKRCYLLISFSLNKIFVPIIYIHGRF